MNKRGNKAILLAVSICALISACSSDEEKAAKKAEAETKAARIAAEKVFKEANYPPLTPVDYTDREAAVAPRDGEIMYVIDELPPALPAEPSAAMAPATQEAPAAHPLYRELCAPAIVNDPFTYATRCIGHKVSGVARVMSSYPRTGTKIAVGSDVYVLKLKSPQDVPRFVFNDTVTVQGIIAPPERGSSTTYLKDVTLNIVPPAGTAGQLHAAKALRLGAICLDLNDRTPREDFENYFSNGAFLTKASLHRTQPHTGMVEVETDHQPQRCLIENNKIKFAQIASQGVVDSKGEPVWKDRALEDAKIATLVKKNKEEAARQKQQKIDAYKTLTEKEKAERMTAAIAVSAEAIAEAIPGDFSAQGYLEMCNVAMATGLRVFKEQGTVRDWENAARTCSGYASKICNPDRRTRGCKAYWDDAFPAVSTMIDAR
jgi:hypothetical protein